MQQGMWDTLRNWLCMNLVVCTCSVALWSVDCTYLDSSAGWIPPLVLLICLVSQPRLRQWFHRFLNSAFESRSEDRAAAGVAGLVGSCSAKAVLSQAACRFRSIQLADLSFDDVANNTPDPDLFSRSSPETLHGCDAFVSHSWHDDPEAKWQAMQAWREDFVAERGREPTVWLDKCCIDQNNIESDLRCLPIFLSGCRQLVIFCGPSYLSRLWCIMELFTFVHMCREVDKIEFRPVLREGCEESDFKAIKASFESFDAQQCTCFLASDKQRMLNIIHAAFGGTEDFNTAVRDIFRKLRGHDDFLERGCSSPALESSFADEACVGKREDVIGTPVHSPSISSSLSSDSAADAADAAEDQV